MLVDSHCHLDFPELQAEIDDVLRRARTAGVGTMLTISTSLRTFPQVRAVAEAHPHVWCTVGLHPHDAGREPEVTTAWLVEEARHPRVVGIGESGLDFHYDSSPREAQREMFLAHIRAARDSGLPLVVHSRDADDEMAEILEREMANGRFAGVLHCFSSGRELAERAVAIGFHVSFSGILTFRKADELRAIARDLPADRLLVETDAPYLAPVPYRGKRNEPAYVARTAEVLAEVRGVTAGEIAAVTTDNFFRLFDRVQRPVAA